MLLIENFEILLTLFITLGAVILFLSDRFPIEAVAFSVLLAVMLTGLVPDEKILSGFSNPATITVASMLVISAGLQRTGIIRWLASKLEQMVGEGRLKMSLILATFCGSCSAFISNTAMTAVMLPVSLRLARLRGISPSKILMPVIFTAQFGGVCTLIGTTTHLLVNHFAIEAGLGSFGIFEFAKLGLIYFVIGGIYLMIAGHFIPARAGTEEEHNYQLNDYLAEFQIGEDSPLIGQAGGDNDLTRLPGDQRIVELVRDGAFIWAPHGTKLRAGDIIQVRGDMEIVLENRDKLKLIDWAEDSLPDNFHKAQDIMLFEVLVADQSNLIGRSLSQLDFYWRYHAAVVGIRRRGKIVKTRLSKLVFEAGDTLLLQGHQQDLEKLSSEPEFIVLQDLSKLRLNTRRAFVAVLILIGMLSLAAFKVLALANAALLAVGALVLTRCLRLREVYTAIDWKIILLLAGLIPLGLALEESGTASVMVTSVLNFVGDYPQLALVAIYVMASILTAFMSNAATAVLLSPLAITMAQQLGVSPTPFLVAVAFAASTCFSTPVGYQTNAMIYGPGGYKYLDYVRVGLPLNIILTFLGVILIPILWPF